MESIEQELMKLEFRHKKDIAEAEQRLNKQYERARLEFEEIRAIQKHTQIQLDHITKLAGITFDKFEDIESRIKNAADALQPKSKSK